MSLFSPSCFGMSHLRSPEVLQFGQLCSCSAVFVLCCVLLGATLPSPGCAMMSPQNSRLRQVVFTGQNQDTWLPSTMISYSAEQNQLRGPATGSGHYRRERSTSTPNIKHPDRQGCARPGNCLPCGLLPWGRKQAPSPVWSSVIGNKPVLCSTTICCMRTCSSRPAESFLASGRDFLPLHRHRDVSTLHLRCVQLQLSRDAINAILISKKHLAKAASILGRLFPLGDPARLPLPERQL